MPFPYPFDNVPAGPLYHVDFIDFNDDRDLLTSVWTFNVTNSTAPTTVSDEKFGVAVFTNATGDNDRIEASRIAETVKLDGLGKEVWFTCRAKVSDATQADYGFGLIITDSAWLGDSDVASDGIWFLKDDGDTNWDTAIAFNAASRGDYAQQTAVATCDTSYHVFDIRIVTDPTTQGKGVVTFYIDGVVVGSPISTNSLPYDEELALSFGVQNGEAAAKALSIDYIGVAQLR